MFLGGAHDDSADVGILGYLYSFEEEKLVKKKRVVRLPGVPWWRP